VTGLRLDAPTWFVREDSAAAEVDRLLMAIAGSPSRYEIKRDGADAVFAYESLILKVHTPSGWLDRLRTRRQHGRLARQVQGAALLASARIFAPRTLAHGMASWSGQIVEILVIERIAGQTLLQLLAAPRGNPSAEHNAADRAGELIARLLMAGLFNRDGKPSNLIVASEQGHLCVIDSVGVRPLRTKREWHEAMARMLSSLLIEPLGVGLLVRRTLARRVLYSMHRCLWALQAEPGDDKPMDESWETQSSRAAWAMTAKQIAAHGNLRPKVSPL